MKQKLTFFDLADGSRIREIRIPPPTMFLEFSQDGRRLLCGSQNRVISVYDARSGDELLHWEHKGMVYGGDLSPDGRLVAYAGDDRKVHLIDVGTGQQVREIVHPAHTWGVAFSPDGGLLATGTGGKPDGPFTAQLVHVGTDNDNTIRLWNVATGKLVRELKGHEHVVWALDFSADGRRLASGGYDGTVRLWNVASGAELSRATGKSWPMKVLFTGDGQTLLVAGGNSRPPGQKMVDFPEERVRVFQLVPKDAPATSE